MLGSELDPDPASCLNADTDPSYFRQMTKTRICILTPYTGRQPPPLSSVLYRIILKDVPYWPHNYSLEKNQVPRELTLIAISLTCLVGSVVEP
jgi:hypothetical protein